MKEKFEEHITQNFPFLLDQPFLIAVSGGIDSVVLAHLCEELHLDFAICHCNFQLRGKESEDDERFVKLLAHQFGKEFYVTAFNTQSYADEHKLSIQLAARQLRYRWFYELLDKQAQKYVLTAHNTNDNLETFLINLTRGTGLDGFTGIPPVNDKSIRPLLDFSRDEIMMYAIKKGVEWREDRSNANVKYIRNKVRHQILPILKEINPNLLESFKNTLSNLNESQQIIKDKIAEVSNEVLEKSSENFIKINIEILKTLSNPRVYLYAVLNEYGFTEWNDVNDLLEAQTGKQVFSQTHRLIKNRDHLLLTSIKDFQKSEKVYEISDIKVQLNEPVRLRFELTEQIKGINSHEIIVDKDLLKFPLKIRKWIHGDYFCPVGMKGTKKISQFFKDRKLSILQKENTWLLTNSENEILWVIGMRQDRRTAISESTKEKLKIILS